MSGRATSRRCSIVRRIRAAGATAHRHSAGFEAALDYDTAAEISKKQNRLALLIVGGKQRWLPLLLLRSLTVLDTSAAAITKGACDQELGQALIERRPEALPAAWRRYHPMVFRMLKRALRPETDVEDLVQDVFLGLFKRAHELRDAGAIRPFIIGIARHTLYRERRRQLRRHRLALKCSQRVAHEPSTDGGPAASYAAVKLSELLHKLTAEERSSFVLRFGYGMTVPEVAEALRVSEPTAKRRLGRARQCLATWAAGNPVLLHYLRRENVVTFFS